MRRAEIIPALIKTTVKFFEGFLPDEAARTVARKKNLWDEGSLLEGFFKNPRKSLSPGGAEGDLGGRLGAYLVQESPPSYRPHDRS